MRTDGSRRLHLPHTITFDYQLAYVCNESHHKYRYLLLTSPQIQATPTSRYFIITYNNKSNRNCRHTRISQFRRRNIKAHTCIHAYLLKYSEYDVQTSRQRSPTLITVRTGSPAALLLSFDSSLYFFTY